MQVFLNQPWRQMHNSLILIVWKNKGLIIDWRGCHQEKKPAVLHTLFVENETETSEQNRGLYFSMKSKTMHMRKLSSFGWVKKI